MKNVIKKVTAGLCGAMAALLLAPSAFAQAPIVIEGGTLIDGNGGAPLGDSVVIIQGNKITAVSRVVPVPVHEPVLESASLFPAASSVLASSQAVVS